MIQIPAHLQLDFNSLSNVQQRKFMELIQWSAAGVPGNIIISDVAFEKIYNTVKQMGEDPATPIEPDRRVNHDWPFDPKQNKGK